MQLPLLLPAHHAAGPAGCLVSAIYNFRLKHICVPCSLTFLSPRKFGLVIPAPVTELRALRRLKLLRIASKQFVPLMLPPGFASLAPTLTEVVLESADWPAIPQVPS